jgi:hypothetical protein
MPRDGPSVRAHRQRPAVGEFPLRIVAAGAAPVLAFRQANVEEEHPAELLLRWRMRIGLGKRDGGGTLECGPRVLRTGRWRNGCEKDTGTSNRNTTTQRPQDRRHHRGCTSRTEEFARQRRRRKLRPPAPVSQDWMTATGIARDGRVATRHGTRPPCSRQPPALSRSPDLTA